MKDYVSVQKFDDHASIAFYIENDDIMSLGEELEEINENADMNGENWAAVLECWLENNSPELLEGHDSDPEAGMYAAYYEGEDGEEKAKKLAETIEHLVENKEELFAFVREYGDDIEWD